MRLAFLGTPGAAVPTLEALVGSGHEVALVITRPDRRRGRGSALTPSPVKAAATALGLHVGHALSELDGLDVQRGIVVAYGAIVPESVLAVVPMLNVHFSLLPRWRGAAPVQRAILAGDDETGVTIISLEASLDTGPIHLERRTPVGDKTAGELTAELASLGAQALLDVLSSPAMLNSATPQRGEATYADKLSSATFHLTPEMSLALALRTVRLEGAYALVAGKRLGVVSAHSSDARVAPGVVTRVERDVVLGARDGALTLDQVRPAGSTTMSAGAWWSGLRGQNDQLRWS